MDVRSEALAVMRSAAAHSLALALRPGLGWGEKLTRELHGTHGVDRAHQQ